MWSPAFRIAALVATGVILTVAVAVPVLSLWADGTGEPPASFPI